MVPSFDLVRSHSVQRRERGKSVVCVRGRYINRFCEHLTKSSKKPFWSGITEFCPGDPEEEILEGTEFFQESTLSDTHCVLILVRQLSRREAFAQSAQLTRSGADV
jgi:hypothetical protein